MSIYREGPFVSARGLRDALSDVPAHARVYIVADCEAAACIEQDDDCPDVFYIIGAPETRVER